MSPDVASADAIDNGLVDEVVTILGTGKEADVYLGRWKGADLVLKVYRLHRTPHKKRTMIGYAMDRVGLIPPMNLRYFKRPTGQVYRCQHPRGA